MIGRVLLGIIVAFPVIWVLFIASGTTFGPAVSDPKDFYITLLNGVTAAALYFVVASGFTLIFGLMRVVNMAHGAFFLFGGYIALKLQRNMVGGALGLRAQQRAGELRPVVRAAAGRRGSSSPAWGCSCSSSSCAGTRARSCARRSSRSPSRSSWPTRCSPTTAASRRTSPGRGTFDKFVNLHVERRAVHAHPPGHPRHRDRHRGRSVALAEEDPHRHGDPRRRGRPRDGLGDGHQHPAHLRDRLRRRRRAGGHGRRRRRLVREPRARRRRQLAPELARGRDHRRHGLPRGRRDRRAAARV